MNKEQNTEMTEAGVSQPVRKTADGAAPEYYTGIDWVSVLFRLLEKIHWIILTALAGAVLAWFYVTNIATPVYQATSKIYIAGSDTTISLSDLQMGSTLAVDYQEVFKIWHVHEMVDERLNLNYSYSELENPQIRRKRNCWQTPTRKWLRIISPTKWNCASPRSWRRPGRPINRFRPM